MDSSSSSSSSSSPTDPECSNHAPTIDYIRGDLFSAPPRSVLAHACNCQGAWGAGVAAIFKRRFPAAYAKYNAHCRQHAADPSALLGTCFLIHNMPTDPGGEYWIACLFTAGFPGARGSQTQDILAATRSSVHDLLRQLHTHEYISTLLPGDEYVPTVRMPQINAGIFNVPWNQTEAVLKSFPYRFTVYVLP